MLKKLALFSFVALMVPQISSAATVRFDVTLDGIQSGTGSPGVGSATAYLDELTGAFDVTGMFSGLNGNATNAHVHGLTASPGTGSTGVLTPLSFDSGASSGSFSGSDTLTAPEISGVLAGRAYINIHSTANNPGEIRGFLSNPISVPEPGSFAVLCFAAAGAALKRRRR